MIGIYVFGHIFKLSSLFLTTNKKPLKQAEQPVMREGKYLLAPLKIHFIKFKYLQRNTKLLNEMFNIQELFNQISSRK